MSGRTPFQEVQTAMNPVETLEAGIGLNERFQSARRQTLELCSRLTPEDMMVQSCPEASPVKWHLAHTAWFFESFILREYLPGYRPFHPDFHWLFNSYYEGYSAFPEKKLRSSFSRPALDEILRYRAHVDHAIERLLHSGPAPEALARIELGANHEEQHQELLLTDILHAFFTNPLRPAYREQRNEGPSEQGSNGAGKHASHGAKQSEDARPSRFLEFEGGLCEAGHAGQTFCFDNELARHQVWLDPYALSDRLVTCGEYLAFMADGGYRRPELWLSAGWDAVKSHGWRAPLYWTRENPIEESRAQTDDSGAGNWSLFTLRGSIPLEERLTAPVSHVSFYEADAYARWAGFRLPTEFEWEAAAEPTSAASTPVEGNLLESGNLMPVSAPNLVGDDAHTRHQNQGRAQHQNQNSTKWFGDCWQWTASAYLPYPGFKPLEGALGEYNGKFMSGQMVLRGGSCVTPRRHIRSSYRNFFPPETRWQFSGIRLAQ
jgi:ergothioneine biosynthesis protein EgtB